MISEAGRIRVRERDQRQGEAGGLRNEWNAPRNGKIEPRRRPQSLVIGA